MRLKYVKKVTGRDGKVRLYFQKAGLPRVALKSPLPAVYSGSALAEEITALLTPPKPVPGLLRGAIKAYETGADFTGLAESTKYEYRLILKQFDADGLSAIPVERFTPSVIQGFRDEWAIKGHRACNIRLGLLRKILLPALVALNVETDPFSMIQAARPPRYAPEPHPLWPERYVELVIATAIEERRFGLARAVAIARYQGPRRSDLVKISRAARQDGRFRFLSGKRKVPVDIEEDEALTYWLEATPAAQPLSNWQATRKAAVRRTVTASLTLVFNMDGQPYTEDGLGQALADVVGRLQAKALVDGAAYDFHGLRHTKGVELALAGCTDAEGAAALGHSSPSSFAQYRRQADRIRLADNATIKLKELRERTRNGSVENSLEKKWKTGPAPGTPNGS